MTIVTTKQDVQVGEQILLLCKGESFQFDTMGFETWQYKLTAFFTLSLPPFLLLSCPVPAGAEGEITWTKDGVDIDEENVKKFDETSSKMIINKATMQDAGRYTCHCEFDSGHIDKTEKQLYVYGT